jgi:preprotein translocase subunit SecE
LVVFRSTPGRGFLIPANFMGLVEYIKETKTELKHVSWPTRRQSFVLTVAVIAISLLVAAYLGAFDQLLIKIIELAV